MKSPHAQTQGTVRVDLKELLSLSHAVIVLFVGFCKHRVGVKPCRAILRDVLDLIGYCCNITNREGSREIALCINRERGLCKGIVISRGNGKDKCTVRSGRGGRSEIASMNMDVDTAVRGGGIFWAAEVGMSAATGKGCSAQGHEHHETHAYRDDQQFEAH